MDPQRLSLSLKSQGELLLSHAKAHQLKGIQGYLEAQKASSTPLAFNAPATGSPFQSLPTTVLDRILILLEPADIRRLALVCRHLRPVVHPHLFRQLRCAKAYHFLRIVKLLTGQAPPSWASAALTRCQSVQIATSCAYREMHMLGVYTFNQDTARSWTDERAFVLSEVEAGLKALFAASSGIKTLRWSACETISSRLAQLLRDSNIQELYIDDRCCRVASDFRNPGGHPEGQARLALLEQLNCSQLSLPHLTLLDLQGTLHGSASGMPPFHATSEGLELLLTCLPSLTTLRLLFSSSQNSEPAWLLLSSLDVAHFPLLRSLDLENCAASSQQAILDFFERHGRLERLRVVGDVWADMDRSELGTLSWPSPDSRAGTFTCPPKRKIALPALNELEVSSMRLMSAILSASSPFRIAAAHKSLRSNAWLVEKCSAVQGKWSKATLVDQDPMQALSACESLVELTLCLRGDLTTPSWARQMKSLLKKLTASLSILRLNLPGLLDFVHLKRVTMPCSLDLEDLSHLTELRVAVLPPELLFATAESLRCRSRPYPYSHYGSRHGKLDHVVFEHVTSGSYNVPLKDLTFSPSTLTFSAEARIYATITRTGPLPLFTELEVSVVEKEGELGERMRTLLTLPELRQRARNMEERIASGAGPLFWPVESSESGPKERSSGATRRNPAREARNKRAVPLSPEWNTASPVSKKAKSESKPIVEVAFKHCSCPLTK